MRLKHGNILSNPNVARQGADYTGIELSRESLKISQERFEVFNLKGRFIEGNVEGVDDILDHESFDLIYSFGVLHHTPDISRALRAIRRIMNNKTVFKLMVYAKNSYKSAMIEEGLDQPEAQYGCPIANTYSKE
jgi:ubiquinone/menaquinone biosynthesis C-methylase UbiE